MSEGVSPWDVVLRCMFLRQCGCWWRILDYEATNSVIYHLPSSVERGNGEVSRECSAVNLMIEACFVHVS